MNTTPIRLAAVVAVSAFSFSAAPALASITDGTSNTLESAKSAVKLPFQGGCSRGGDVCLMESEGLHPSG